ncbi:Cyclophilin-like peptidyl-prolyl cis-trans isomerase domain-containing protein [Cynara cardunculus var. scolymus]|uniref:Cyclophilin-like peptidyl-prolyl cis-trans isomerase domain-containing protein n=1 Tax=Cynara cardunculus var. scolymus TaxID=59895 RepID=A0A103Y471_CYNCS|nr:Cyclophilin-like peptidyl-prolyl cis-trans isomerase domain-containing protein [Cynara cardunculus var. scolymus]
MMISPAKTCNNLAMAVSLSSSISSPKVSINVAVNPSASRRYCVSTRSMILFSRSPARSLQRKLISCIFSKLEHLTECSGHQKIITKLYVPALERGVMRLGATISVILVIIQLTSPVPLPGWDPSFLPPAKAVLYSPDTKVPRTGELALRKAIPANTNMKSIQNSLEELSYLLRIPQRKPYGTMEGNVKKALKIAVDEKESILASIPADQKENGLAIYASLIDGKGGLQTLLGYIKDKDPDKVSVALASSLDSIAQLELLQVHCELLGYPSCCLRSTRIILGKSSPRSFIFSICIKPGVGILHKPSCTSRMLTGRAIVEFVVEKGDGSMFTPQAGGVPIKAATIQVVLDGYSAPLTTGNFAKLVVDGAYDGMKLKCTDQAVLSDSGINKSIGYSVPLEIMPSGQFEPLYKTTLSIQDGELPVLPLSVYGAVAMAHDDSGLGGLSFDEGQFSVFGYVFKPFALIIYSGSYTTIGRDVLPQIKTGDIVRSAKLVDGQDNLVLPSERL